MQAHLWYHTGMMGLKPEAACEYNDQIGYACSLLHANATCK